jgi:hypothetical protein
MGGLYPAVPRYPESMMIGNLGRRTGVFLLLANNKTEFNKTVKKKYFDINYSRIIMAVHPIIFVSE